MKLKKPQVPPKIRSFIDRVLATPFENIDEPLRTFVWDFDKDDFDHWVDLFDYFDTVFDKYIKPRKDLLLEDDFLEHDPRFPKENVLQILRVVRVILENCANEHFYSTFEHHLSSLLASTDVEVVEASLQTLATFLKNSNENHVARDPTLSSKLFSFAQGWGSEEEGLGLISCALENGPDPVFHELGSTLHFEFYLPNDSLQIIHLPKVNTYQISDSELMQQLVKEYKVPLTLRFSLLTRLRFARAFASFSTRLQYICVRLHAFMVFVQACGRSDEIVSFFNTEIDFVKEMVTLLSYEDAVHEKVRIFCLLSLVSLCQDRIRQPAVLSAVTSGAHRGILSSLMRKAIESVACQSSNCSVDYAEALVSLVTVLVSSSSDSSLMCELGFIPTLLPLLKDTDFQHLHFVTTAVHLLEAFVDYDNPAAALFRDLGGLDDTIARLRVEVINVENGVYSDVSVTRHQRSLMKALLRVISLGTYAPGTTSRLIGSEESLLPYCLCVIFKKAKDFGGGVFSLAATVMNDLIHKDPTCFPVLQASGISSAFLTAITNDVLCSSEAIICIPQCLEALCLNSSGLQVVKDNNAFKCFLKIFTTRNYLSALTGDTLSSLSSSLHELMKNASSLCGQGVGVLIEILTAIEKLGHGPEASSVPMETDGESSAEMSLLDVESFLPDCVNNVARLLESIFKTNDVCRVFVEMKGVEAVLKLLTLPLMPLSVSIGPSIAVAFKNFSSQHYAALSRSLCVFLREHLKLTNELLISLGGIQISQVEDDKRTKVLRCLSCLEEILFLSISLTKLSNNLLSELSTSDAVVVKDLGVTFKEILWQQSLCCDLKTDENQSADVAPPLEILIKENLSKLSSTLRSFFITLVKGVTSPNRRRTETVPTLTSIGIALAKVFLSAFSFPGYTVDTLLTLKCRYLGKVVDHMAGITFDNTRERRKCYSIMINTFYVQGTFKEFLNTFEATSQLLWTLPVSVSTPGVDSWLLNTLTSFCHVLEFFVNSTFLLPPDSTSHAHLVIQPVADGLSPTVPKDPKMFVRMLQSQVLNAILPLWNNPMFPRCSPGLINKVVTLLNHVYCDINDTNLSHGGGTGGASSRRFNAAPPPDEATIATIVGMGFTRRRVEEALRHVGRNSVEMATDWLFANADEDMDEDDEMAEALALSLGGSSETAKSDNTEKSEDSEKGNVETNMPPIDDVLTSIMKLVQSSDSIAFPFTDLLITLCNREKGEDRNKVISYLIQQMKLCPLESSKDTSPLCTVSHTLALLLTEDVIAREIAAENAIVSVAIDILTDFNSRNKSPYDLPVPKCISALLLILNSLMQFSQKLISDSIEGTETGADKVFEKSIGYLTVEEGNKVITVVCDMIRKNVSGTVMHAVLLVCARLTKKHTLALSFLENGGLVALYSIPRSCFVSYESVISAIIRHLIEDSQTLQTAMESAIRQTLSSCHYDGRILSRTFLTLKAPLISRDPEVFMKAVATVCQSESSEGTTWVVLSKEKEKDKDKSKGQKKIPANLTEVIHHMLEIITNNPLNEEECARSANAMEVDEPAISKGKSKVDETEKESESVQETSGGTAKLTFVLKLLCNMLSMHVSVVGVFLKRDGEISQLRGSNGIVHLIVNQFLHPLVDKDSGSDSSRSKLSENASQFLLVLCGRSSEGRRRVINELVKALFSFSNMASYSSKGSLLPDEKIMAFAELLYSILSKNSSPINGIACSDIAKGMIDGGMIPCLSSIIRVMDLDHPDAPKVVNIILKVLEGLTRAANASDQISLSDSFNKKKPVSDNQHSQNEVAGTADSQQLPQQTSQDESDNNSNLNQSAGQEMRTDTDEMEESGALHNSNQIEVAFHVDNSGGNNTGDEDDDMEDDDEDDDVDGDDEDGDISEDGPATMSLADTDVENQDEDNVDMDEEEDEEEGDEDDEDDENRAMQELSRENRTHIERSATERNGFQHPLLSRASQSDGNADISVGIESIERRGVGESPWTDDGQPRVGRQDADIAQAIEAHFVSWLHRQSLNSAPLVSQSDVRAPLPDGNQHGDIDQNTMQSESNQMVEGDINREQVNSDVAGEQTGEDVQTDGPALDVFNVWSVFEENMEIGEGDASVNEQELRHDRLTETEPEESNHQLVTEASNHQLVTEADNAHPDGDNHAPDVESTDVDINVVDPEANETDDHVPSDVVREVESSEQNTQVAQESAQSDEGGATNGIDPTFLEALPEELRAEVLASQQARSTPEPDLFSVVAEDIDPEFLAALPPEIQAEVLAQQRAQRIAQQAEGQPVEMDTASIIATFPPDLRQEVLLTSPEAVLSALSSPQVAERQMLRDRSMSHYHARSLSQNNHNLNNRRNGIGIDRQTAIGHKASSSIAKSVKGQEVEGDPLLDIDALKALIGLLRLEQPLVLGYLQRLLLNLCANSSTRVILVYLLLEMIKPETEGTVGGLIKINSQRLYGCRSSIVYGRSQLIDGLPPVVLRRILEILTYLATNHSCVADILFYLDSSSILESMKLKFCNNKNDKGKRKVVDVEMLNPAGLSMDCEVPILLFTKLLNHRSIAHLEQKVLALIQVVVYNAASNLDSPAVTSSESLPSNESAARPQIGSSVAVAELGSSKTSSDDQKSVKKYDIFMKLPQTDLHHLCSLLGHEGLSDKVYTLTVDVLKKLASIASIHRKFFIEELSSLALTLSSSAIHELTTLRNTQMRGLSTGSVLGGSVLRILQTLNSLTVLGSNETKGVENGEQEHVTMSKLNVSLEPLWQELSECAGVAESQMEQVALSLVTVNVNVGEPPLPPGTQRLLPFIEAFLVLCEKLQTKNSSFFHQDNAYTTAREVKQLTGSSSLSQTIDGALIFTRFAEKHRRLLNAFVRQDPSLLNSSLSMLLKAPRLMEFDNKRSYFRSKIRQQHEQNMAGPLRVTVRRAYVLEDSYNQLRIRSNQDMKGRLNVHFRGEEGVDAGGVTREWYQLLSRVIFDKGALLFTTSGNNATFQPNPNSVYQTEHLSYFKFVGRVVAKALLDGQLLDVYFTRSFYKHILGVKVTYHDIEAVDPDYYKNLKWMLENDVSEIPDLTFSMDADEEKQILYEKTEVTEYELKPGGGNIRVTEDTKHEYVDLVADHILTNAIRPQINSFLEGFNELIPREFISIFNDKELELLISGLPEIDLNDLKVNTEYTGYTAASSVITWFWEVVNAFNKEDRARLLQFVTGTSKVPLEGFKALQGISGPQWFQIHKAYGAPDRLPSAHTCFNQLDLPEYKSMEQLQERLLLAIHEASEGFGFA